MDDVNYINSKQPRRLYENRLLNQPTNESLRGFICFFSNPIFYVGKTNRKTVMTPEELTMRELNNVIMNPEALSKAVIRSIQNMESLGCIMLVHPDQIRTIGRGPKANMAAALLATGLVSRAPDPIIWVDPPPSNTWHPKPLSKKNYGAPRQSFRACMRSVNRNR